MTNFRLLKRSKKDYFCEKSPRLILIADKPLHADKFEIFDSPSGTQFLCNCFKSSFKSVDTHVTWIEENGVPFSRNFFFNILGYYYTHDLLDASNLGVAFVNQVAFDSFMKDYCDSVDGNCTIYVNKDRKFLKIYAPFLGKSDVWIPYIILSEKNDEIINSLNELSKHLENKSDKPFVTPYVSAKEFLTKLDLLQKFYNEGVLKVLKIDGRFDAVSKKFIHISLYDNYFKSTVIYCPSDEISKEDTIKEKSEIVEKLKNLLTKIPVYCENDSRILDCFPFKKDVEFINKDKYEELVNFNLDRPFFDIVEISSGKSILNDPKYALLREGIKSDWYNKWRKDVLNGEHEFKVHKSDNLDEPRYGWIYDIEVYKEDFLVVAFSMDKRFKMVCWNAYKKLGEWVKNKILIGFNNAAYDDNVIKYAIAKQEALDSHSLTFEEEKQLITIKQFSDNLINDKKVNFPFLRKFTPSFLSWDLGSHLPFNITQNSLKKLTMSVLQRRNYDTSVPFDIDRLLTEEERIDVEKYCALDVDNTMSLFLPDPEDEEKKKLDPKHKARSFARETYDVRWNLINSFKLQAKTLINKDASFAGKVLCGENAKPNLENTFKIVNGKKQYYAIPELAYKELAGTDLLNFYIKNQTNPFYITEKFEVYMGGNDEGHKYQFGFGGLHQALINYGSKNLVNMDVASLYPSLLIQYGLMSRGASNPDYYEEIYHTRINAKHNGDELLNKGLKLILNAAIGAMLSDYNPLYDTWANSSICVHGQLLVFILAKRLYDAGLNIVQTNTDGIMIETKEGVDYMVIAEQWMKETRLVLEFDEIAVLQQNNVNNYYCQFCNGKVKSKGVYLSNEKFGKATSKILCNMVTGKPIYDGVIPKDYVIFKKHGIGEIYDAETRTKVDGRSLAFVVGKENDPEAKAYYSRSRNVRKAPILDEKGHKIPILDAEGNPKKNEKGEVIYETEDIHTESKISGFSEHMLLIDDMNNIDINRVDTQAYVNFAKNLIGITDVFGPYYTPNYKKVEEPDVFQALNPLKDNTENNPTNSGVICQNLLFECDYLSKEEQEELIERIKDEVYRIVWSGHRSYHIIVRLNHPITSTKYKQVWQYLQYKFKLYDADPQASYPSKYTRVPGQINPKTGEEQKLYMEPKHEIDVDEILEQLPKIKDEIKQPTLYKGKRTIEALKKHIAKQEWSEGNRFSCVQKLSPNLITLVPLKDLLEMIPLPLDRDHINVLKSKIKYYEKMCILEESGYVDEIKERGSV